MSTNSKGIRYDEDFKRTLVIYINLVAKHKLPFVKNTEFLRLLSLAGSNNTQLLKQMMVKS